MPGNTPTSRLPTSHDPQQFFVTILCQTPGLLTLGISFLFVDPVY
ncbi:MULTISPECIES: hypothetical protein [unclassified Knoellia]